MFTSPDARTLDDTQRRELTKLTYAGLVEIRSLLRSGRHEQAAAVVEAFHNLPLFLYSEHFSFAALRQVLEDYQAKFAGHLQIDFLAELDRIASGGRMRNVQAPD
jgi:hypothetical protein